MCVCGLLATIRSLKASHSSAFTAATATTTTFFYPGLQSLSLLSIHISHYATIVELILISGTLATHKLTRRYI
ncbi:hypothetical protein CsatB_017650 [Cannabis sativa]|uniref:Uncharacterized protein n=1 Tax=Cannabis sativa TaxID=3483 RepID=A0A803QYZ8_CANSA